MPRVPAVALAVAATLLVFTTLWLNYVLPGYWKIDIEQFGGNVGGIFGFSSALFTGLAFVGLVYAVKLQRDELQIARDSLDSARAELAVARENQKTLNNQLEMQNQETTKNSFEDTFFRMINELDDIMNNIKLRDSISQYSFITGESKTETFEISSVSAIRKINELLQDEIKTREDEAFPEIYDRFYADFIGYVGHYFRWLYYVIIYIDQSTGTDKLFYINLLRARLSDEEITLISYNGAVEHGKKLKPLIEKYSLLKNINRRSPNVRWDLLQEMYSETAFEGTPRDSLTH